MFTVGNAVTLVIVIGLLFIFRKADRDNRSLDRVRKTGDRLRDELSEYVEQRAEDLQRFGIELDVKQKAAKVVLDKLQTVQDHLVSRTDSLEMIEKRLSEYDKTLDRLVEMTSRVDENLARLEGEGKFIEGANKKLDHAMRGIKAIEAGMTTLGQEFHTTAEKELVQFKEGILNEIAVDFENTRTSLAAAREEGIGATEQARAAREQIEAVFNETFERARREAVTLEDDTFRKLEEASSAKAMRLAEAIEEKFLAVGQAAKNKADEIEAEGERARDELAARGTERLGRLKETLEIESATIIERISGLTMELDATTQIAESAKKISQDAVEKASGELSDLAKTLGTEAVTMREDAITAIESRLAGHGQDVEAKLAVIRSEVERQELELAAFRTRMNAEQESLENEFASYGQAMEDHRTRFEEAFRVELADIRTDLGTVHNEVTNLRDEAFPMATQRLARAEEEFFEELGHRSESFNQAWNEWIDSTGKRLEAVTAGYEESRKETERTRTEMLDQLMEERSNSFLDSAEKRLDETRLLLESRMETIASSVIAEEESVRTTLAATMELAKGFESAQAEKFILLAHELDGKVRQMNDAMQDAVDQLRSDYAEQREVFEHASRTERDKLGKELAALAEKMKDLSVQASTLQDAQAFKDSLSTQIGDLARTLADLEKKQVWLATAQEGLQKIAEQESQLASRLSMLEGERKRLTEIERTISKIAVLAESTKARADELAATSDTIVGIQARLGQIQEKLSSLDGKFERLDKKSPVLEATTESVDRSFERARTIEQSLSGMELAVRDMPIRIEDLSVKLGGLASIGAKAEQAAMLATEVEKNLSQLNSRSEELTKAREWIARAESRLTEIDREAGEKMRLLADLMEEKPGRDWTILPGTIKETVLKLGKQGWTPDEIARTVQVSRSEVDLILELVGKK